MSELDGALARARAARARRSWSRARAGSARQPAGRGPGAARDAGMLTLHARGSELERAFPFGVVRQLFEPALFAARRGARSLLAGAAGLARPIFEAPSEDRRVLLRAPARPLLAVREPRRRAAAGGLHRRRAVGRRAEPELRRLPAAAARGPAGRAAARHPPAGRAGVRRPARDRHRPGTRSCGRPRSAATPSAVGPRGGRRARRRRRSAPPATRPPAGTRSWSASCCTRCIHKRLQGHRRGGRRGARARPRGDHDRRPAAPQAPARLRPGDGAGDRDPRRGRPARARRRARRASTRPPPRRRSRRSAAPTCSPATSPTGSASCTRSCSRRSTPTCPSPPAATATPAPPGC